MSGMVVGAALGFLIRDKDKKRIWQALHKQTARLRKQYENLMRKGAEKAKTFVREHLP